MKESGVGWCLLRLNTIMALTVSLLTACDQQVKKQDPAKPTKADSATQHDPQERSAGGGIASVLTEKPPNIELPLSLEEVDDGAKNSSLNLGLTPPLMDYAKADTAMIKGTELLQQEAYIQALEHFEMAAEIDTENEEIYFNLGYTLSKLGRTPEAVQAYQKTVEIFPDYGEAHNNLGNLLLNEKAYVRAIRHFHLALEINPDHASAQNNLGTALSKQGKIGEAVPHFIKATRLEQGYIQAWCNLGNAYLVQGRTQDAEIAFSTALSINASFTPARRGYQRVKLKQSSR